jgi:hypothetical protein
VTFDVLLRIAAGLAAVAVVAAPVGVATYRKARAWAAANKATEAQGVSISDMRTVLELADRLRQAGCTAGVSLCQQLLDVMLKGNEPQPAKKATP